MASPHFKDNYRLEIEYYMHYEPVLFFSEHLDAFSDIQS